MSKFEKLLKKFVLARSTFPWNEFVLLLSQMGYDKQEMKGSRVRFYNVETKHMIRLHKPHPENAIKGGALKSAQQSLKKEGLL